jgi:transcription initiation factor TFIID subunit 1
LQLPNRLLHTDPLVVKIRDLKEVDRFNLSNDQWYLVKNLQMKKRIETIIQHSIPAIKILMVKTHLEPDELREFHRPRSRFPLGTKFKIVEHKEKLHKRRTFIAKDVIRHRKDLSAREGRVILCEYVEEYPLLLSNVGMGSKIRNYYRKKDASDNTTISSTDGDNIYLEPEDPSPFLGNIPPGVTVSSIENNLYKAPMFRHTPRETDFMLIRSGNKYFIREIPAAYTVGQMQPLMEVPAPNSRETDQFLKNRLQAYIYRTFRQQLQEKKEPCIKIVDVARAFPGQSDAAVRGRLKACATFRRGGDDPGSWVMKEDFPLPSEEQLRALVTPEDVCKHESMLAGAQRLRDIGIERLHEVKSEYQAAIQSVPPDHRLKRAVKLIEEELQLTPWNLTKNFINAMHGRGVLQLTGFGDPSGRGEAYSYLRLAQKIMNPRDKEKEPRPVVTGTDADLRKLSLEGARLVLLQFGVSEEKIAKLGRWERIDEVRKLSNEAKRFTNDSNLIKFARGGRSFTQTQQQYNEKVSLDFATIFTDCTFFSLGNQESCFEF